MNDIQQREEIKKAIKDFVAFLKDRDAKEFTVTKEKDGEEEIKCIRPAVVDILLQTEKQFFAAMAELERKHSSLTTIEDIATLTKQILKLAK